ncbi:hypothetical protein F2Q68_00029418 [Brassica cretica]|uniref:FMN hydroxy acid dehydrogenase domain-containing protein n=1 Tax=Brassica cretica TaxID=69181 RepID=A0A8S9GDS5_BRACR|nr:hypothetical protein F2Q68_00029418 [Brassica cretica]
MHVVSCVHSYFARPAVFTFIVDVKMQHCPSVQVHQRRVCGGNHHPDLIPSPCGNYPAFSGDQSGTGFDPTQVVKAVEGRLPVFLDGGVRRGTDVFKALALGASGVFVGRSSLFSLAADGEAGVRKMLQMLRDEFELTMALSGCRSLREISRNHIKTDWDFPHYLPAKL